MLGAWGGILERRILLLFDSFGEFEIFRQLLEGMRNSFQNLTWNTELLIYTADIYNFLNVTNFCKVLVNFARFLNHLCKYGYFMFYSIYNKIILKINFCSEAESCF